MAALISGGLRRKTETGPAVLGRDLRDAQEEVFTRMVCDGLALGVAFIRAGFNSSHRDAPYNLWNLPRVQERAAAILEARRTTGVVTLPEVTAMLQRVYSGAVNADEYSAAHNAAFSLARLYGHVTDKATLEVIRRPSRDPDAPSEQALGAWVSSLGGFTGPGPDGALTAPEGSFLRVSDALAAPLGPDTNPTSPELPNDINWLAGSEPLAASPEPSGLEPQGLEKPNEINDLNRGTTVAGRPENGAPTGSVTGTPDPRAHATLLSPKPTTGPSPTPTKKKRVPPPRRQVPATPAGKKRAKSGAEKRKERKMRELFG